MSEVYHTAKLVQWVFSGNRERPDLTCFLIGPLASRPIHNTLWGLENRDNWMKSRKLFSNRKKHVNVRKGFHLFDATIP